MTLSLLNKPMNIILKKVIFISSRNIFMNTFHHRIICVPKTAKNISKKRYFSLISSIMPKKLKYNGTPPRILITGAGGQIGTEIMPYLCERYGQQNIIASDVNKPSNGASTPGKFVHLDVCDYNSMARICMEYNIDWVLHLAALLSAVGEQNPKLAMKVNNIGVENVLDIGRLNKLRIYIPSSIAAFGLSTPRELTPNLTIQRPSTIYGITKVYSELLGEYYFNKYGVDFRSLRYPGIISSKARPTGGTTDYAVHVYHEIIQHKYYECFLKSDTYLPMMYMPDCVKATLMILEADNSELKSRVYNVSGMSFCPSEQFQTIKKIIPDAKIEYKPDFKQAIADSWPVSICDEEARKDWDWMPTFDLDAMSEDMIKELTPMYTL